jgi:pseudouridine kinase
MNEAEAIALAGQAPENPADWPVIMRALGLNGGVMTRGMRPAIGWNTDMSLEISPPKVDEVADVTGAGDAFAAGALHAFSQGADLAAMLRHGAALSLLTVLSPLAVAQELDAELFGDALGLVPQPTNLA